MTTSRYHATDVSKFAEIELGVIRRHDLHGNQAGGFTVFEGGPKYTIAFKQAEGRRFVEDLAAKFGGTVSWGLAQDGGNFGQ